ncbi:MAG: class I SAM-dependent methyltransferase [Pseudobdellovibrionaceae bacterium]
MATKKLKEGHKAVFGFAEPQEGRGKPIPSAPANYAEAPRRPVIRANENLIDTVAPEHHIERAKLFTTIPLRLVKRAYYTASHLLLDDGAHVVDMGCGNGDMVYALATLKPNWTFTAYDSDPEKIAFAKANRARDNVTYIHANVSDAGLFKENQFDAVIDSFMLHEIYSSSNFNIRLVRQTLEHHYNALKPGGYMFIRDYAMPAAGEYVLMEMRDLPSSDDTIEGMSEGDLLLWFSEHVRSGETLNTGGFFLEELPARFPNTRLFRLPYKWAYEFIIRKDDRELLIQEMNKEYTFATHRDLRKEMRSLGARLIYTAGHWNDDIVNRSMVDKFRLFKEDGTPLGYPETSYILLVQKVPERDSSIRFQEWRATRDKANTIKITPVRNANSGETLDIATRDLDITEVLPYRVTDDNRLKIYMHESIPRSLVNTVPRSGKNLDERQWSGHMFEAVSFATDAMLPLDKVKAPDVKAFYKNKLSLETEENAVPKLGPTTYPDPKTIDERVNTRYICVKDSNPKRIELRQTNYIPPEGYHFLTYGHLREYDAQSVLNAIGVGLIPAGRLEAQIHMLYRLLNLRAENWAESPLALSEVSVQDRINMQDIMRDMAEDSKLFAPVKHEAGQLRLLQSVFLEEGQSDIGGMTDLSSETQDFFVHEEKTQNLALVLPLTRDLSGEVLAGVIKDYAPVPERYKGNGTFLNVPSIPLPAHIDNIDSARRYIAEHFKVKPQFVGTLGEPFYQHIGMTPQRVFPFAIASNGGTYHYESGAMFYAPVKQIWDICALVDNYDSFIKVASLAFHTLAIDNEYDMAAKFGTELGIDMSAISRPVYETSESSYGLSSDGPSNDISGGDHDTDTETDAPSSFDEDHETLIHSRPSVN